ASTRPRTPSDDRTARTRRRALGAHRGTEIEDRLTPRPRRAGWHGVVGELLRFSHRQRTSGECTGHETTGVRVHETDVSFEREDEHGARRIRADAWKGEQRIEVVGEDTSVALADERRGAVQVHGAAVVAETVPRIDDL